MGSQGGRVGKRALIKKIIYVGPIKIWKLMLSIMLEDFLFS